MKAYVKRASDHWGSGKVKEFKDLQECINTLLETEDFDDCTPSVIVSKADDMTKDKCGERCDYEILIYDDYIE